MRKGKDEHRNGGWYGQHAQCSYGTDTDIDTDTPDGVTEVGYSISQGDGGVTRRQEQGRRPTSGSFPAVVPKKRRKKRKKRKNRGSRRSCKR